MIESCSSPGRKANPGIRLQHHILPDRRAAESIPDFNDHDNSQRVLDANLVLHNREIRSTSTPHLGRGGNDSLRIRHRNRWHGFRRLESSKLRPHRLRVSVHLLLRFVSKLSRDHSHGKSLLMSTLTAHGALQDGSSSARSSSCPSAPKEWLFLPPPTGSGTASSVSRTSFH